MPCSARKRATRLSAIASPVLPDTCFTASPTVPPRNGWPSMALPGCTPSGACASACRARSRARAMKSSFLATKSVSQLSSIIAASCPLVADSITTSPWEALRSPRLSALAMPFLRRISTALSMSPLASCRAALQSIIPAPVRARSSATIFAEIGSLIAQSLFGCVAGARWGTRVLAYRKPPSGARGPGTAAALLCQPGGRS